MLNKVILMGRLVADPEFRQTTSGIPVCRVRIAVDRPFRKDLPKGPSSSRIRKGRRDLLLHGLSE